METTGFPDLVHRPNRGTNALPAGSAEFSRWSFIGSGQTALAARKCKRRFVGYDTSEEYIRLARNRLSAAGD